MSDTQLIIDKIAVAEATAQLAYAQDDRDWPTFRSLLADRVHFDLSKHLGMTPNDMSNDQLTLAAQHALNGFEATQHTVMNVVSTVKGDHATARAHVVAYHYLPTEPGVTDYCIARNSWQLALERIGDVWRFTQIVVTREIPLEGDAGLYELAARRAQAAFDA